MHHKKIIIAGGSGFIGESLTRHFSQENQVVVLSRMLKTPKNNRYSLAITGVADQKNTRMVYWDGRNQGTWSKEIDGADIVINLSGKSVNCRYTAKNKREIIDRGLAPTTALGVAIQMAVQPPSLWINVTSATIYRHAADRPQDEYTGEIANDFSVQVCKQWEESFFAPRTPFTRKVAFRTAVTLGSGGVMIPFLNLARCGFGGPQGSGTQMFSWVHIADVWRAIEFIFQHKHLEGVFNLSAPNPVTNARFMKTLRTETGRNYLLPTQEWMLKIGAAIIGTEPELLLKSRWVVPAKLLKEGFSFSYLHVEDAVHDLVKDLQKPSTSKTSQQTITC